MRNSIAKIAAATAIRLCVGAATAAPVGPRDITPYVKQHTILDESVALRCMQYCRGNERRGRLDYVNLAPGSGRLYRFTARATLQNRHVMSRGAIRAVVYDFAVLVHAAGTLDPVTCIARIERVWIENDRLGLSKMARQAIGRTEQVANCRNFIAAAGFEP